LTLESKNERVLDGKTLVRWNKVSPAIWDHTAHGTNTGEYASL